MALTFLSRHRYPLLLLLLGLCVSWPLFRPGLPATDDGISMVIRASAFHQSFLDGHLPVRWLQRLNENYGYPVINFLYPLPFYLAEIPNLIGFSALDSVKIVFILATVLSALGFYLWATATARPLPAFIAASLYVLAPYRFTLLYQRGSLGEVTALAIAPFIFWQLDRFLAAKARSHLYLAAGFYALLILAHNSLALIFSPVIFAYLLAKAGPPKLPTPGRLASACLFAALAFGLSAFFWLPAILELAYTQAPGIQIARVSEHFQNPLDLLVSLGLTSLVVVWAALGFVKNKTASFWSLVFSFALAIQIPAFLPVWQLFGLDRLIQFPFRFLTLAVFASAALVPYLFAALSRLPKIYLRVGLALFGGLLLVSTPNFFPAPLQTFPPGYFEANFDTSTNQKEFTPRWVQSQPATYAARPIDIESLEPAPKVVESFTRAQSQYYQISSPNPYTLTFNTHYYPGWQPLVDDNPAPFEILSDGRIRIRVQPQSASAQTVKLVWQETPLRKTANAISLVSLLVLTGLWLLASPSKFSRRTSYLALALLCLNLGYTLMVNRTELLARFDPVAMRQRYLDSQWVNPQSQHPIGDHGLYSWAGWAYLQGENPILINPETPPLGKYFIGAGILLTQRPGLVGLFFSSTSLLGLLLLGRRLLGSLSLAIWPVVLFSFETIFRSQLTIPMLESFQLTFTLVAFYLLTQPKPKLLHFILASLAIGAVLSSKFYVTGVLLAAAVALFFLLAREWSSLRRFLLTTPFIGLVNLISYTRYFTLGHTFREYLGVQKYILNFYLQGGPRVPFGSYWLLVFANRWRVWWGPRWGEYYTLSTKEWNLFWPANGTAAFVFIARFLRHASRIWLKLQAKPLPRYHLLTSWLLVYGLFLTFIGGWPHYLFLFLPFSYILLFRLLADHRRRLSRLLGKIGILRLSRATRPSQRPG